MYVLSKLSNPVPVHDKIKQYHTIILPLQVLPSEQSVPQHRNVI